MMEIRAVPRAVLHAFELAGEDVRKWCGALTDLELTARPAGLPPIAFHLRHIARSLDRLLTYAEGRATNASTTSGAARRNGPRRKPRCLVRRAYVRVNAKCPTRPRTCARRSGTTENRRPKTPAHHRRRTSGPRCRPHPTPRGSSGNHRKDRRGPTRPNICVRRLCSDILAHPEGALLEAVKTTLLLLSALFPIVNPLGGSPIFLALTGDYAPAERRLLSQRIAVNSFMLLVASCLIGTHILAFFGISLPIVQVGGGLIVVATGWDMLRRNDDDDRASGVRHEVDPRDIYRHAFYPLTLPLTVGPGSISVAITLGANAARLPASISWTFSR